ncbi:MAG: hypothetical protein WAL71_01495 [Terriglobales bacterium]|jgi:hypothetical protein
MKKTLVVLLSLCAFSFLTATLSAQTIVQQFAALSSGGAVSDMDLEATAEGSTLIAMPFPLTPGLKVESVTDNAPDGGNTYKQVPGSAASCEGKSLGIWYCEKCHSGVTELKFHLSGRSGGVINAFAEVSGLASTSVLDGDGVHVTDGTRTSAGSEIGPEIKTTAKDFIIARYFTAPPPPTGVTPAAWTLTPSFAFVQSGAAGTYQPTLTAGGTEGKFCMSVAAFKTAAPAAK